MNENLFRKSSIDRVNSPEQLNEYIRVAKPSVWIVLAAVILLLAGVMIWGVFGNIETAVDADIFAKDGEVFCYVSSEQAETIEEGMEVCIGEDVQGTVGRVVSVDKNSSLSEGALPGSLVHHKVLIQADGLSDGSYKGKIVTESIHPISFILH